jgi:hypothetical protein
MPMTYQSFIASVQQRLEADVPDPKTIEIYKITKNNGQILDGLVILEEGRNIAPAIYLDSFYRLYREGRGFEEVYHRILLSYQSHRADTSVDVSFFTDYRKVKHRIAYKLVNYEKNRELLTQVPHVPYLDLAIVFFCLVRMDVAYGNATILVTDTHMEYWQVTAGTLLEAAAENTEHMLGSSLKNIRQVIRELEENPAEWEENRPEEPELPMYVLTNESSYFGAACMLYEGLLENFARELNADLYILPSSIHEVILVPATRALNPETLSHMVREVNQSSLMEEEILSDHAYYYRRTDHAVSCC